MSTESAPQTTTVDPYSTMPSWLEDYYKDATSAASGNITESEALADIYSDPNKLIADYNGQPATDMVTGAAQTAATQAQASADKAVSGLTAAEKAQQDALKGVSNTMKVNQAQVAGLNTELGQAFDTTQNQAKIDEAARAGTNTVTSAIDSMSGAMAGIGGVDTNLGTAFDTAPDQSTLRNMDISGIRSDYENQYLQGVIDPTMRAMKEDAANRAAALETAGAAVGGLTNTRMGVTQAKMAEEAALAQAQAEAEMRFEATNEAQAKALEEAALRGDLTETAAQLGLSESELSSQIKKQQADLGITQQEAIANIAATQGQLGLDTAGMNISAADTAAKLGMSQSELDAEISRMETELGLSKAEATQKIQNDLAAVAGQNFGAAGTVSNANLASADTALASGALGMEAGQYVGSQAELERQIEQQKMQAPLTMQAWENEQTKSQGSVSAPSPTTTTTTGGGPSTASQLLGAGTSLAGAAIMASDERVKHDIQPLDAALDVIRRQRPSVYAYDDPSYDRFPIPGRRSAGLMAQDLEDIPGAVVEIGGVKHVDLYPVVTTITAAVQSLDRRLNQRGL
jgi:hypothetical protein